MKTSSIIIIIISLITISLLSLRCYDGDDYTMSDALFIYRTVGDCYDPFNDFKGYEVSGAGSSEYNGLYLSTPQHVNGNKIYIHENNTDYTIEYDYTNDWCIRDNGSLQYCTGACPTDTLFPECTFSVLENGASPLPTHEKYYELEYVPCGL